MRHVFVAKFYIVMFEKKMVNGIVNNANDSTRRF